MEENKKSPQNDEIDLLELFKVVWSKKWLISKIAIIFAVLGVIIAFTSPKEFEASCTLIPEATDGGSDFGGLKGLASIAGVDFGGLSRGGSTINPMLYESIAKSTPFLLELMNRNFYFDQIDSMISVQDYYTDYYQTSLISKTLSAPGLLKGLIFGSLDKTEDASTDDIISLTKKQKRVTGNLKSRINVAVDRKLNVVMINVEMQDPKIAAYVTKFTLEYITEYVTNYSISKSREQLEFIGKQFIQRKREFEEIQMRLATFRDRNTNVNSARARSEEERLQSEYNLAFNIYNQLAQQQESVKLQLNEETPVFTVLEPVKVPAEKSAPKRKLIIIIFLFVGVAIAVAYTLIKEIIFIK